jgi:plastocyanin
MCASHRLIGTFCLVLGLSASGAEAKVAAIVVNQLAFGPAPADLHVGDTVEWDNRDLFVHSVTANDGSFDVELPVGARGKAVLKHDGVITYYCRYHPGMKGELNVAK